MQDRVPVNPGRVLITPENGSAAYYATMTRADNPTQEGTPLNKASLLKDATAALFGLGTDAVPDDALSAIKTLIDGANANANAKAKFATGSYTGTGTYGASNPNGLMFDFAPKFIFITAYSAGYTNVVQAMLAQGQGRVVYSSVSNNSAMSYSNKSTLSWSGNNVSWYSTQSADHQLNNSSYTYYYLAIG